MPGIESVAAGLGGLQSTSLPAEASLAGGEPLAKAGSSLPFEQLLTHAIENASDGAAKAAAMERAFSAGESDDIHGTMIAVKEAEIDFRLVTTIRNKVIDAFQDLWRTNL